MLLRGVAMVTIATGFKDVKNRLRAGCLGYHSDAPEQHEINSYITIFLILIIYLSNEHIGDSRIATQ